MQIAPRTCSGNMTLTSLICIQKQPDNQIAYAQRHGLGFITSKMPMYKEMRLHKDAREAQSTALATLTIPINLLEAS